jgi:hypothetical protein
LETTAPQSHASLAPAAPLASREQLLRDGYTVLPGVLSAEEVRRFRDLAQRILHAQQQSAEYREKHRAIGSLVDLLREPGFVDLITHPGMRAGLAALGFPEPRYQHGIVFNKLPHTPRTFWHQDGTLWDHPAAYEAEPLDLILIYYLVDTSPANGCLRVIPGSHRRRHALHSHLQGTYTPDLRAMKDPSSPAFQLYPDEVSVAVRAGSLVVTDARLLHAAHANDSDEDRTALSLWYLPSYEALPEPVRARYTLKAGLDDRLPYVPQGWPEEATARLRRILPPAYAGTETPLPMNNLPDQRLR